MFGIPPPMGDPAESDDRNGAEQALAGPGDAIGSRGGRAGDHAFGAEPPPRIDDEWELIGAEAGGRADVQTRAWLLDRDGTRFASTISVDHSDHTDPTQLIPVLEGAVNLMAEDRS